MLEKVLDVVESPFAESAEPHLAYAEPLALSKTICSTCIYDEDTPAIVFDENGVCNYCKLYERLNQEYPTGAAGAALLDRMVDKVRAEGRGKPFDVVVGVSGGCDSSYLVYKAKELGLRPLAVHFDNTWNSKIATENIHNVLGKLNVELYTHVVDNEEFNDILRAFVLAGVPDIDCPTDIGLATTLYMGAAKYGIKYQFEGHSFRTEGVSPLGWMYMDGKYIKNVVQQYGNYKGHKLKTFPNLWLSSFFKYILLLRIKKIRPLYWLNYDKEETKEFLTRDFGWKWYGGHHLENRWTTFYHSYFLPRRFNIDQRRNGYSALIRSGQMTRAEGLRLMSVPPPFEPEILDMVKKRLGFSDEEFERAMNQPLKTFRDFKTYKPVFERLRPLFRILYRMDLVPQSFYVKYTSKTNI